MVFEIPQEQNEQNHNGEHETAEPASIVLRAPDWSALCHTGIKHCFYGWLRGEYKFLMKLCTKSKHTKATKQ